MVLKYNPLLTVRLDDTKVDLSDLEDVNCAGTVNGNVLTFSSGTWIADTPAGGGDMLKAVYVTGAGITIDSVIEHPSSVGPDLAQVPIPGALWLMGSGLLSLIGIRRYNRG